MVKIDAIDKKISDLLIEDGRMSCAQIAARIGGISERAVRYRVDRLINNRVIAIRGNVIPESLGLTVCADVFIECEPAQVINIAKEIAAYERVSYLAYSTGDTDISIQVFTKNNTELFDFVTDTIGKIPGVRRTHISLVPIKIKDDHVWHIPSFCIQEEDSPGTYSLRNPQIFFSKFYNQETERYSSQAATKYILLIIFKRRSHGYRIP